MKNPNTTEANPLALVEELREVLLRYIPTSLPISQNYPSLRSRFQELLQNETLIKGPYVEALPDFEKGKSIEQLLRKNGGFLHDAFAALTYASRPLHLHQQQAMELSCRDGKSIMVATGTGSGKTETFLYPIVNKLLQDPDINEPGVRALIIYPMNALANDQLYYRLAPLLAHDLKSAGITFGRFTGHTKSSEKRDEIATDLIQNNSKLMEALGDPEEIPDNWLLSRAEMLERPPHILITNYAMLEHLLLLPKNAPLFEKHRLKMIALDEIHVYRGAQATEVAFLIRKLKNRLEINQPLQVFGTSASLAPGKESDEKLKEAAYHLFGEKVDAVVRGKRIPHAELSGNRKDTFKLNVKEWVNLANILNTITTSQVDENETAEIWNEELEKIGLKNPNIILDKGQTAKQQLMSRFSANEEIRHVAKILSDAKVRDFKDLALEVFVSDKSSDAEKCQALSSIIHLGMMARKDVDGFPLFPARYHVVVNSIEGVCINLSDDKTWKNVRVGRYFESENPGIYYPLLVCRRCGQPYIEGYEHDGFLLNRRLDLSQGKAFRKIFWLGQKPQSLLDDEEDEADTDQDKSDEKLVINYRTGKICEKNDIQTIELIEANMDLDEDENVHWVKKCEACGSTSTGKEAEIVTTMHPGNDALSAVVVQNVLNSLPPPALKKASVPLQGRGMLSFADSRQGAAFFAPNFEQSAQDIAIRTAIYQVVKSNEDPLTFAEMAPEIRKYWRTQHGEALLVDRNGEINTKSNKLDSDLTGLVAAEFCTAQGRRNSLEALGMVKVTYDEEKLNALYSILKGKVETYFPNPADLVSISHILLETIRREKAIKFKSEDVDLKDDYIWGAANQKRAFEYEKNEKHIKNRWVTPIEGKRQNRRLHFLMEQLRWERDKAFKFLEIFWDALKHRTVGLLVASDIGGFALDADAIRLTHSDNDAIFRCRHCGLLHHFTVKNRCRAYNCDGEVEAFDKKSFDKENHYTSMFIRGNIGIVRAKEHTAHLSSDLREEIEREFSEKKINLLSCSPTMELGVDLGDLEAVACLNIPRSINNYQQRTGRAGRRAQAAPFCVTIARNSQYDQSVFKEFSKFLETPAPEPRVSLQNSTLFERHQLSIVMSYFLKDNIRNHEVNSPKIKDLFGDKFGADECVDFEKRLNQWVENDGSKALAEADNLATFLPESAKSIALDRVSFRNKFIDKMCWFSREVRDRYVMYQSEIDSLLDILKKNPADDMSRRQFNKLSSLQRKYFGQLIVNWLSQNGMIPTYSFPTHSLTLEIIQERGKQSLHGENADILLSRDASLGISEYAPGSEVIANGRIWTSSGIAYCPREYMPKEFYSICPHCKCVETSDKKEDLAKECEKCGEPRVGNSGIRPFIKPRGFITSYSDREGKRPNKIRKKNRYAEEAKLIPSPTEDQFQETDHQLVRTVLLRAKPDTNAEKGEMFIVNKGSYGYGYIWCESCNYAEAAKTPENHMTPHQRPLTGENCGTKSHGTKIDLAHKFETDVRILRFTRSFTANDSENKFPNIQGRFARTLCEAVRFAACQLLEIDSPEIRATFRMDGERVEVVLFDAVPGGAGYCARLGEAGCTMEMLLQALQNKLTCPQECSGACRACLCDYDNQFHWDLFDRHLVLKWLTPFLNGEPESVFGKDAIVDRFFNFKSLGDELSHHTSISLIVSEIGELLPEGSQSRMDDLITWLKNKTVTLYLTKELKKSDFLKSDSGGLRRILNYLLPYVDDGKLRLGYLKKFDLPSFWRHLRLFFTPKEGTPAWFTEGAVMPYLAGVMGQPVYKKMVDEKFSEIISTLNDNTKFYSKKDFQDNKANVWILKKNQKREFSEYFSVLKDAVISEITIFDPYCVSGDRNRDSLVAFLKEIKKITNQLDPLKIEGREINRGNPGHEKGSDIKKAAIAKIQSILPKFTPDQLRVPPFHHAKTDHDRTIRFKIVDSEGCESTHLFELTGGIDHLMDVSRDTKIFYYIGT